MMPCYKMEFCTPYDLMRVRDALILPRYQRAYVWTEEDACDFVDTILMGLPVGSIIMREIGHGQSRRLLVIDGQQRISTLLGQMLGNGGQVHDVCIEPDPTADDDPVRALGCKARAVIGSGPGRIPIHMMTTKGMAMKAIPVAADGRDPTVDDEWRRGTDSSLAAPYVYAEDMIRFANIPWLVFKHDATDAQVVEAFRRINVSGVKMDTDEIERLLKKGVE